MIAVHDDHGVGVAHHVERRPHRAAGSIGLRLHDGLGALREGPGEVAVGRDDHADAPGAGLLRGENRPGDHRPAADRVQDLGHRRAHPRALAGGHDQDGGPAHLRNRRAARATRRAPRRRMVTSTPYGGVNVTLVLPVVLRLVAPTLAAAIRGGVVGQPVRSWPLKATEVRFPPPELWRGRLATA